MGFKKYPDAILKAERQHEDAISFMKEVLENLELLMIIEKRDFVGKHFLKTHPKRK